MGKMKITISTNCIQSSDTSIAIVYEIFYLVFVMLDKATNLRLHTNMWFVHVVISAQFRDHTTYTILKWLNFMSKDWELSKVMRFLIKSKILNHVVLSLNYILHSDLRVVPCSFLKFVKQCQGVNSSVREKAAQNFCCFCSANNKNIAL